MFRIFKRYKRRPDDKSWTKNTLLSRMYEEIGVDLLEHDVKYNIWRLKAQKDLSIEFESSNYPEKNEVKLINSIYFKNGKNVSQLREDLRDIARQAYGTKYEPLHIRKDELFEGSSLQRECIDLYRPFFNLLSNQDTLKEIVNGGDFDLNGHKIKFEGVYKNDHFEENKL